jgi:hypothetical protein
MVVNEFNLISFAVAPRKTDAPLVIDANAVLTSAIPLEFLQSVSGWGAEIRCQALFRRWPPWVQ